MEFRDLKKQYVALKSEIDREIADVLSSATFISGAKVRELEKELADYVGVKHCISCANGTDAITLGLMTWEIGEGDAVFVPDFTFFSSGECPALLGATPVFVDVNEETYNMDPISLKNAIENVIKDGMYTPKAVVCVDLFGLPAEYDKIKAICKGYGLWMLEDSAQGFGGAIKFGESEVRRAGSFGDISTTSFFPAKPLGCYGDGGAIFTDNDEWAELIRSLAIHGKSGENKYDNVRIGMNSRLDTLQAAILLPKFRAFVDYELADINEVAMWYQGELRDTEVELPFVEEGYTCSWAQFTIRLPQRVNRDLLQAKLRESGIPTMVYYKKPMHLQGAFYRTYSEKAFCPITEKLCSTVLSLPIHPYMKLEDVMLVSDGIRSYLEDNK